MVRDPATPARPSQLPLFQFGLRHLFGFVAAVSVLLAGMVVAGGVTALVLLLATLVVAAHVTGTALGTRLRSHADRRREGDFGLRISDGGLTASNPQFRAAPRSPWQGRGGTPLPWLTRIVAAGAVLGGVGGVVGLALTIGHRTSLTGLVVGAVSIAVLGGWLAFLSASFYAIFRHGWREAVAEQKKDEARGKNAR